MVVLSTFQAEVCMVIVNALKKIYWSTIVMSLTWQKMSHLKNIFFKLFLLIVPNTDCAWLYTQQKRK